MAKVWQCEIRNLQLSKEGLKALNDIRYILKQANYGLYVLGTVPLLDLFLDKGRTSEKLISVASYDWLEFESVISNFNVLTKKEIRDIAEPLTWKKYGKEGDFWRCISDATNK